MAKVKKPIKARNNVLLGAVFVLAILFIIVVLMGFINKTRDYYSCVSNFRESAYKGSSEESKKEIQSINNSNQEKHKAVCSDIFLNQSGFLYLFNAGQRKRSIIRYCDNAARDLELAATQNKANLLSPVLFGETKFDYNQSYSQCTHMFGQ